MLHFEGTRPAYYYHYRAASAAWILLIRATLRVISVLFHLVEKYPLELVPHEVVSQLPDGDLHVLRGGLGPVPLVGVPVAVDQPLPEVPENVRRPVVKWQRLLQIAEDFGSFRTIYVSLGEPLKLLGLLAELLNEGQDLLVAFRLLGPELVAREAKDLKPPGFVTLVELDEVGVVLVR